MAKNVNGVVITSSPGPMPRARSPMTSASVPELHATACLTARNSAISSSKARTCGPRTNCPDRITSAMAD